MPTYTLLFRVGPPGLFGLPDGQKMVVDSETGSAGTGPVIDTRTGNVVSYGQLSRFRAPDEALALDCPLGQGSLSVVDNLFRLRVDADDQRKAIELGTSLLDQLVRLLSVEYGGLFPYETLQIESDTGVLQVRPGPRHLVLFEGTIYSISGLRDTILEAASLGSLSDDTLSQALVYHEHAQWLFSLRAGLPLLSPHFAYVVTSAYLHLWKTITAILGDPAKDRDYQSRYRTYGLSKNFWADRVKPIRDVRNDQDVAHYSLELDAIERVERSFGDAHEVCKVVIRAYSKYLLGAAAADAAGDGDAASGA